jgi:2-hydroxy-3-keto-5-methylthiopentenyl-1-phosphate phosphatase
MIGNIVIQCDFDGTITEEDISFLILDAFADGDWRQLLGQYREGKISVGYFNTTAFAMVKESEATLKKFVERNFDIRGGFGEMVKYCQKRGLRFVIVSNGMEFYIRMILEHIGLDDIEVIAAKADFRDDGIRASYIGPGGNRLQDGFKKEYTRQFLNDGYHIVYIGNGASDVPSARLASHVFATGEMLDYFRKEGISCTPFGDFKDVIKGLELLE